MRMPSPKECNNIRVRVELAKLTFELMVYVWGQMIFQNNQYISMLDGLKGRHRQGCVGM